MTQEIKEKNRRKMIMITEIMIFKIKLTVNVNKKQKVNSLKGLIKNLNLWKDTWGRTKSGIIMSGLKKGQFCSP